MVARITDSDITRPSGWSSKERRRRRGGVLDGVSVSLEGDAINLHGLIYAAISSTKSFGMATIWEPGSITPASVLHPSTRTSISWRGSEYPGSANRWA